MLAVVDLYASGVGSWPCYGLRSNRELHHGRTDLILSGQRAWPWTAWRHRRSHGEPTPRGASIGDTCAAVAPHETAELPALARPCGLGEI